MWNVTPLGPIASLHPNNTITAQNGEDMFRVNHPSNSGRLKLQTDFSLTHFIKQAHNESRIVRLPNQKCLERNQIQSS